MSKLIVPFYSSLAREMTEFVNFKRLHGYDYTKRALRLAAFDRFLCEESYCQDTLTREITGKYIDTSAHIQPDSRLEKLSPVRVFSKYLQMFKPESYVIGPTPFPVPKKIRFYLYSRDDLCRLIEASRNLPRADVTMSHCLPVLFGLLYTTGLRISEALKLNIEDIDFNENILHVRDGKFGKERYVPLHSSVIQQLENWLTIREDIVFDKSATLIFVDSKSNYLKYGRVRKHFHKLIVKCDIGKDNPFTPRIHDLRHTFACNCVNKWRRAGEDINAKLPILSTAMGHVDIYATQKYLHVTTTGLYDAADRFHAKAFIKQQQRDN